MINKLILLIALACLLLGAGFHYSFANESDSIDFVSGDFTEKDISERGGDESLGYDAPQQRKLRRNYCPPNVGAQACAEIIQKYFDVQDERKPPKRNRQ